MYSTADAVSMKHLVIESVLFTPDGYFSGFELKDLDLGILLPIAPESMDGQLMKVRNAAELVGADKHTRLVGFRTSKLCQEATKIMSVQPIYFSVDRAMCKDFLTPITKGLTEEISSYGPRCGLQAAVPVAVSHDTDNNGALAS